MSPIVAKGLWIVGVQAGSWAVKKLIDRIEDPDVADGCRLVTDVSTALASGLVDPSKLTPQKPLNPTEALQRVSQRARV